MNPDDRARLRARPLFADDEDVIALLDHIDQLEARAKYLRDQWDDAEVEIGEYEAKEKRLRALHEHRAPEPPYVEYCEHCGADWPCETIRVLDGDE